jgi:hypothetical protein
VKAYHLQGTRATLFPHIGILRSAALFKYVKIAQLALPSELD